LVLHHSQPADPVSRINFCNWLFRNIHDDSFFLWHDTWFHLSGYRNSQKHAIGGLKNPHYSPDRST
jgi:hypothetical protein